MALAKNLHSLVCGSVFVCSPLSAAAYLNEGADKIEKKMARKNLVLIFQYKAQLKRKSASRCSID